MAIKHIITPREKDLGGFSVRRVLPYINQQMVGPWIFFDHMGPADFSAGKGIDVRPHPHINLATVTYLFEGEILHRDSLGSLQTIQPGDINLMVAGKGITHSERERDEVRNSNHRVHGLQLWHVLPEKDEEIDPAFYHYPASDLPYFSEGLAGSEGSSTERVSLRLMMGSAYGLNSPVKTFAETVYVEAAMNSGNLLPLPNAEQLAVYIVSGSVRLQGQDISSHTMVILEDNTTATIQANADARVAIIGGEKMPKRFIEWNFVSSRKERIEQAKDDWQAGRFPKVVDDEKEFIPLPEKLKKETIMDTLEAIKARRAVKHYDASFVMPPEDVNTLLEHAIEAPTSFNIQHWRLVMVTDKALRGQIREAAWDQAQVTDASLLFVMCADVKAWNKSPERYWRNAPKAAQEMLVPMIKPFYQYKDQLQRDEALRSIGIAAQTIMLSAKAMGYDSCPMIGFDAEKVAQLINLPDDHIVGMLLVVGKGTKEAWPKPGQLPLSDVVINNSF